MADKRIFTVEINGIKEPIQDVGKLVDSFKNLNNVIATSNSSSGQRKQALTEQEKAQAKLQSTLERVKLLETDLAKEQIKANEQLKERQKEVTRLTKLSEVQTGSLEEQRLEIDRLTDSYRKLSKTDRESDFGVNLFNQIKDLKAEYRGLEKDISNRGLNIEDSLKNMLGLNNQFADSILSLSTSADTGQASLSGFFNNAGASSKAFGQTLLGLLANPVFLAIAGIAGAGVVFKFWYDYNKGLVEATRLTKEFTGLADEDLKFFRNEVQAISDTFGKDFKETLEAANALSKQFGISQQEALKNVKDGFLAGADANGEYLQTLKEYPTFFKEAGISASQFVAIVADTSKAGIFSDKGVDAIKEGTIRIREMTKATSDALNGIGLSSTEIQKALQDGSMTIFDVIKQVSEKLNELPANSQAVGTAIADIFGGAGEDAGLQYLQTLKDIELNLDTVKSKSGELGEIQERQLNANIELQNVIAALFDQTGGTFESMIGNTKVFVTESITSMIKGIIDVINYFIDLYNESKGFRASIIGIKQSVDTLFDVFKNLFNYLIDSAAAVGDVLKGALTLDYDAISRGTERFLKTQVSLYKNFATDVKKSIQNSVNELENPTYIERIKISSSTGSSSQSTGGRVKTGGTTTKSTATASKSSSVKQQAKDYANELIEERIKAISEAEEREIKTLENNARKRLEAIKGEGEKEKELRRLITENSERDIQAIRNKYSSQILKDQQDTSKKELENTKNILDAEKSLLETFYKEVEQQSEKSFKKNGIIDVQATTKNLNEANKKLDEYLFKLKDQTSKQIAYYDRLLSTYDKDGVEYKKALAEKQAVILEFESKEKQVLNKITDNTKTANEAQGQYFEEFGKNILDVGDKIMQGLNAIFDASTAVLQSQLEDAQEKYDEISEKYDEIVTKREESDERLKELDDELKNSRGGRSLALREQIDAEMIANQQLANQEKDLAREKERQQKEIEKKEKQLKKENLKSNIANAIATTAAAVIEALGNKPFGIWNIALAALIGSMGAVQVGIMSKQLTKLEDGGLLSGKRHSQGGMRVEGTNIEVEGGEYVVNREATRNNLGLIRYINSERRELGVNDLSDFFSKSGQSFESPFKKMFETGGQLPMVDAYSLNNDSLANALSNLKIESVVSVSDINRVHHNMVTVDQWTGA